MKFKPLNIQNEVEEIELKEPVWLSSMVVVRSASKSVNA